MKNMTAFWVLASGPALMAVVVLWLQAQEAKKARGAKSEEE